MSIEENFNKRNSKLQQKIELEIEKVKYGSVANYIGRTSKEQYAKKCHFKLSSDYSGFMGLFRRVRCGVVGTGRIV